MQDKLKNNYSVYQHVTPDNMYYFGQTNNIKRRWKNNGAEYKGTALYPYIEQYGWDNIKHIVLFKEQTKENALWIEDFLIETAREDGVCINKNRSGLVSKEEGYKQQYYEENKDKIREQKQQYYEENKDKILEQQKQYYEQNKDKKLEQQKQYYEQNKQQRREYLQQYYEENKDKIREQKQQYYEENKDKILEQQKQYYEQNKDKRKDYLEENKDKIRERRKQYYEQNKQQKREYQRQYRERKKKEKQFKEFGYIPLF